MLRFINLKILFITKTWVNFFMDDHNIVCITKLIQKMLHKIQCSPKWLHKKMNNFDWSIFKRFKIFFNVVGGMLQSVKIS